jgi:hypothetical protein
MSSTPSHIEEELDLVPFVERGSGKVVAIQYVIIDFDGNHLGFDLLAVE